MQFGFIPSLGNAITNCALNIFLVALQILNRPRTGFSGISLCMCNAFQSDTPLVYFLRLKVYLLVKLEGDTLLTDFWL